VLALSALRNLLLSPAALVSTRTFVAPNIPATEPQAKEGGGGCGDAQAQREEEEEEEGGDNSGSGVEVSRQGSVAGGLVRGREDEDEEEEEKEGSDKEGNEILKRLCFKEGAHVLVELLCAVVKQGSASSLRNVSTVLYDRRKRRYMLVLYVWALRVFRATPDTFEPTSMHASLQTHTIMHRYANTPATALATAFSSSSKPRAPSSPYHHPPVRN